MFPSKISPSLNIPDLHPKVTYCFSEGSAVSSSTVAHTHTGHMFAFLTMSPQVLNGMSLSGLESFVKEQERFLCGSNGKEAAEQSCERSGKDKKTSGKTHAAG